MDEEAFLEMLEEYEGNWKDRQYREHIIREVQKMQHLSILIEDHKHNPRDQLMLEASKRKTVIEIEKKYIASTTNATFVFPLSTFKSCSRSAAANELNQSAGNPLNGNGEVEGEIEESYNHSLDIDFYNLKAQNNQKRKKKVIPVAELNKVANPVPAKPPNLGSMGSFPRANNENNTRISPDAKQVGSSQSIRTQSQNDHKVVDRSNISQVQLNQSQEKRTAQIVSGQQQQNNNNNNNNNTQANNSQNNVINQMASPTKNTNQPRISETKVLSPAHLQSSSNSTALYENTGKGTQSQNRIGLSVSQQGYMPLDEKLELIPVRSDLGQERNLQRHNDRDSMKIQSNNNRNAAGITIGSPGGQQVRNQQVNSSSVKGSQRIPLGQPVNLLEERFSLQQSKGLMKNGDEILNLQRSEYIQQSPMKQQNSVVIQQGSISTKSANQKPQISINSNNNNKDSKNVNVPNTNNNNKNLQTNTLETILARQQKQIDNFVNPIDSKLYLYAPHQPQKILTTQENYNEDDFAFDESKKLQVKQIQSTQLGVKVQKKMPMQSHGGFQNGDATSSSQGTTQQSQSNINLAVSSTQFSSQPNVADNFQTSDSLGYSSQKNQIEPNAQLLFTDQSREKGAILVRTQDEVHQVKNYLNNPVTDSQRKSTAIRGKKNYNVQHNDDRLSASAHQNYSSSNNHTPLTSAKLLPFAQTQTSHAPSQSQSNKWIDFKKQPRDSERVNGNNVQIEEQIPSVQAAVGSNNTRNTYNSMSPNGHFPSNSKKGSNHLNNYLSLNSALAQSGSNKGTLGQNKQIQSIVPAAPSHLQHGNTSIGYQSTGQLSYTGNSSSGQRNQGEFSSYQVKNTNKANGQISDNLEKNNQLLQDQQQMSIQFNSQQGALFSHSQMAQQQIQQQQLLPVEEVLSKSKLQQQQNQRKQMNKVNSCKSFEIRDKFSKSTMKSSVPSNAIINLSVQNNSSQNNYSAMQYTNSTTHTVPQSMMAMMMNLNQSANNNQGLAGSSLISSSTSTLKNNLMNSSSATSYLPNSSQKNTYSAALYQKSQNNILNKQVGKSTGQSDASSNSLASFFPQNPINNTYSQVLQSSQQQQRNPSVNPNQNGNIQSQLIVQQSTPQNNVNLNAYLTNPAMAIVGNPGNNSNNKLAKKIDMYKVFNTTSSNSFSNTNNPNPKEALSNSTSSHLQSSSVLQQAKQTYNIGSVLHKIMKNKSQQQQADVPSSSQHQIFQASSPTTTTHGGQQQVNMLMRPTTPTPISKKSGTPTKKKIATSSGTALKSPQFSSQLKLQTSKTQYV